MKISDRPEELDGVVKKIIKKIADKYTFGIYEEEDIGQEIWLMCLDAIDRWDGKRSLYNFLLTHCKNRLRSLKRDKYFRYECPCKLCNFKEDGQTDHKNKKYCSTFLKWRETNNRKSNLANPQGLGEIQLIDGRVAHEEEIDRKDFLDTLDREIPVALRSVYLRMLAGATISYIEKEKVLKFLEKYTST